MNVLRRTSIAAIIAAGLISSTPAAAQEVDTERPTVPTPRASISNATATTADASWGTATDNVGVTGYNIYVDGIVALTSPTNAGVIEGLDPATEYQVYVRAFDAAGNEGWRTGITRFTTAAAPVEPDTERPSVPSRSIRLEPNGRFINWGAAVDNRSVVKYLVFDADSGAVFAETSGLRFELPRDAADYRLFVKAEDAAGNRSWRTGITEFSINGDPDRPSIPTMVRWSRPAAGVVSLTWSPSMDNIGVVGYRVYTEDRTLIGETPTNSITFSFADAGSFYVKAFDAAGNESYRTGFRAVPAG